jgi:hypothetical protein
MKTHEDVEALKAQWYNDPTWSIEETEGFDAYKQELLIYRLDCEAAWGLGRHRRLVDKAMRLGVPENIKLVEYLEKLEQRIEELEQRNDDTARI